MEQFFWISWNRNKNESYKVSQSILVHILKITGANETLCMVEMSKQNIKENGMLSSVFSIFSIVCISFSRGEYKKIRDNLWQVVVHRLNTEIRWLDIMPFHSAYFPIKSCFFMFIYQQNAVFYCLFPGKTSLTLVYFWS